MKKSKVAVITLLLLLGFQRTCFSQDFTSNLVAYWPFCACSLNDQTGNGHDATLLNGPTCVAGIRDQAYEFDGTNSIVVPFSNVFDISPDSAVTLSVWVKPLDVNGAYQALVVKGTGSAWDYGLYLDISRAFMFGCSWPNHEVFSQTIAQNGVWYNVVGVYQDQIWKIFVNGQLEDSVSGTPLQQSQNGIGFGKKGIFVEDEFTGVLDEIRVYNRALSDADVAALYHSTFIGTLSLSSNRAQITATSCDPLDTAIQFEMGGCGAPSSFSLDSVWLSGSSAFNIISGGNLPRQDSSIDSIVVKYNPTPTVADTSVLHIQYHLGSGEQDTTIQLIGSVASPFLTHPTQIHREAASAYFGQIDTLLLGVDISSQINLDSLWPYITSIQATYSWDSSVVSSDSYIPPAGWSLTSLASHGNSEDIGIQNSGSTPTQPMDLGTALFRPHTNQLATTWVTLPTFVIDVGSQALSLCVTDNEDNHWAVKTLGVQSGVAEVPTPNSDISIYPNPAEDELFVQNTNEFSASITMYDEIGREIANANAAPSSTSSISMESLPSGAYFLVCRIAGRTETKCITKE